MALIVPDTSVLIPYLTRRAHTRRVERALRGHHLVLCSVVAEEILAGARHRGERQSYDAFFAVVKRLGRTATPDAELWSACGHIISRYRERYGSVEPRDHQNDVLIMLVALQLAREQETALVTENDADFNTWLGFVHDRYHLRIEAVRR